MVETGATEEPGAGHEQTGATGADETGATDPEGIGAPPEYIGGAVDAGATGVDPPP